MWCLTVKEAESLELQRISESACYAGSSQDFFSPLREIRFFHHFEEDQEQLFGGLVSAQLDGAVPEPEPPLVGPLWRQWLINYSEQNLTTFMALLSTLHSKEEMLRGEKFVPDKSCFLQTLIRSLSLSGSPPIWAGLPLCSFSSRRGFSWLKRGRLLPDGVDINYKNHPSSPLFYDHHIVLIIRSFAHV